MKFSKKEKTSLLKKLRQNRKKTKQRRNRNAQIEARKKNKKIGNI